MDNDIQVYLDTFLLALLLPLSVLILTCVAILVMLLIFRWRLKVSWKEYRAIRSAQKAAQSLKQEEGAKAEASGVLESQCKSEPVYESVKLSSVQVRREPCQFEEREYATIGSTAAQLSMSIEMATNEAYQAHRRDK